MNIKFFLLSIYSFFTILLGVVLMLLFKKQTYFFRKIWASSVIKILDIDIEEIGNLDKNTDLIVLNHNSLLDIFLLDFLHPKEISWVTKDKLSKLPLFGYILKIPKLILIDPTKLSSLRTLLKKVREANIEERVVGIFPEGQHGDSDEIAKFEQGIKIVTKDTNLRVQPIVLLNTRYLLDTQILKANSGTAKIIYLPTVNTSNKDWFRETEKLMSNIYNREKY